MKLEEHFKETLEHAVANEPPAIDAWTTFEHRVRRERRMRVVGSIFAIAALIVAAVLVVPKLGGKPARFDNPGPPPESPSPSPSSSAGQYAGWETFEAPAADLYTLRHPRDWRVVKHEGSHEVLAPGQVGTQEGTPTMAVTVELVDGEFDDPDYRRQGFVRSTRTDGRPYIWIEYLLTDGSTTYQYRIDWSTCVSGVTRPGCIRTPQTLFVSIVAGTTQLWERYGETALKIVSSIEYVGPAGPYVVSDSAAPFPQSS